MAFKAHRRTGSRKSNDKWRVAGLAALLTCGGLAAETARASPPGGSGHNSTRRTDVPGPPSARQPEVFSGEPPAARRQADPAPNGSRRRRLRQMTSDGDPFARIPPHEIGGPAMTNARALSNSIASSLSELTVGSHGSARQSADRQAAGNRGRWRLPQRIRAWFDDRRARSTAQRAASPQAAALRPNWEAPGLPLPSLDQSGSSRGQAANGQANTAPGQTATTTRQTATTTRQTATATRQTATADNRGHVANDPGSRSTSQQRRHPRFPPQIRRLGARGQPRGRGAHRR